MLIGLHVKNLALIEQADVEFGNGLNILTGETGAGKSIIIGSVALALGAKASKDMIRRGEDYAYIELTFSVDDEKKREELKSMDVYPDDDGLLIISKKITPTRSISRINDETVTTARLKAVTGKLLDIHGQHEHQSLLHRQKHLEILDEYSRKETGMLRREVAESYRKYLELKGKLDGFSLDDESRKRELDFIRFEITEIENAALRPGEEEELAAKFRKYAHSQKIMESLQAAYQVLDSDMIGRACHEVENVSSYDERLSGIASGLSDAESILSDLCRSISGYLDEMEFSGEDFQQTEERLDLIPALSWKSHVIHVKEVGPGIGVSYGATYVTEKPMTRIATVSAGYADGYPRALSNQGCVLIHGKKAPIIGRICMDQMMVDVTDIPDVQVEDVVTLVGTDGDETITIEEIANPAARFDYEMLCDISSRVTRVYK